MGVSSRFRPPATLTHRGGGWGRAIAVGLLLWSAGTRADAQPNAATSPPAAPQLSTKPGHYDFPGLTVVKMNGKELTPPAALAQNARDYAAVLPKIQVEPQTIGKSVRIVIPDHDRLRPLIAKVTKQSNPMSGVAEFFDEQARLELHQIADVVVRSHVFEKATIVEQNDTVSPDPAGADYVIWYQVRTTLPNNAGLWVGHWQMKWAGGTAVQALGVDPGTPVGAPRLESFVKSVKVAATNLSGGAAIASTTGPKRLASSGSGIVINGDGYVLTNNHVVATCPDLRVLDTGGETNNATLAASDATNDLAVMKAAHHWPDWARFRDDRSLKPGESLVVTGFPLGGLVSPEMAVTTGSLTALAGLRGDTRQMEISAPVQPGNSGGPVLDDTGQVIGVTVAMLNGVLVAAVTGTVPQNVNFAIKSTTAREFLDAHQIPVDDAADRPHLNAPDVAALARKFTVKIECWR